MYHKSKALILSSLILGFSSSFALASDSGSVEFVSAKINRSGDFIGEINLYPSPNSVSIAMEEDDNNSFDLILDEKKNKLKFDFASQGVASISCSIESSLDKGEQIYSIGQYQFTITVK